MKRVLYYMVCCLGAWMFSCSSQEENLQTDVPIQFGESIEVLTKSVMRDTAFMQQDSIRVYAYRDQSSEPFLSKEIFTYSAELNSFGASSTNSNALWWRGVEHDFYAYYPASLNITEDALSGHPTYSVSTIADKGIDSTFDFLYAHAEDCYYEGDETVVDMTFAHIFSKIRISFRKNYEGSDYTIDKATLVLRRQSGVFDMIDRMWTYGDSQVSLSKTLASPMNVSIEPSALGVDWMVLPGVSVVSLTCRINGRDMMVDFGGNVFTKSGMITTLLISVNNTIISFETEDKVWAASVSCNENGKPIEVE